MSVQREFTCISRMYIIKRGGGDFEKKSLIQIVYVADREMMFLFHQVLQINNFQIYKKIYKHIYIYVYECVSIYI